MRNYFTSMWFVRIKFFEAINITKNSSVVFTKNQNYLLRFRYSFSQQVLLKSIFSNTIIYQWIYNEPLFKIKYYLSVSNSSMPVNVFISFQQQTLNNWTVYISLWHNFVKRNIHTYRNNWRRKILLKNNNNFFNSYYKVLTQRLYKLCFNTYISLFYFYIQQR